MNFTLNINKIFPIKLETMNLGAVRDPLAHVIVYNLKNLHRSGHERIEPICYNLWFFLPPSVAAPTWQKIPECVKNMETPPQKDGVCFQSNLSSCYTCLIVFVWQPAIHGQKLRKCVSGVERPNNQKSDRTQHQNS